MATNSKRNDLRLVTMNEVMKEAHPPPPPRMKNLTEVIDCLEDIRSFLEQNSHAEEATRTDELLSAVTRLKCTCSVQASITDFSQNDKTP